MDQEQQKELIPRMLNSIPEEIREEEGVPVFKIKFKLIATEINNISLS